MNLRVVVWMGLCVFVCFFFQAWEKDMVDKKAVAAMYEDAEVFQSSILESRQAEHAAEVMAAEERARAHRKQKKVVTYIHTKYFVYF